MAGAPAAATAVVFGSMEAGNDSDSSSNASSSAPESDDEIELEINEDAVAELNASKPAFVVPSSLNSASAATGGREEETEKVDAAPIVDDTFGISYQRKTSVRETTADLASETPWTREYDRLGHDHENLLDSVLSATKTETEPKTETEMQTGRTTKMDGSGSSTGDDFDDDFDVDLTVPDLMPRSSTAMIDQEVEKSRVAMVAAAAEESRVLAEKMKAEIVESLAKQEADAAVAVLQGGSSSGSSSGSLGQSSGEQESSESDGRSDVKNEMNRAARELFDKYSDGSKEEEEEERRRRSDNGSGSGGVTGKGEGESGTESLPPSIRLSIVAGQRLDLHTLAEGEEEEEEEDEEEEEEEEEEDHTAMMTTATTAASANVEDTDSEGGEEVVIASELTKEETKEEELQRLNMEFDRLSALPLNSNNSNNANNNGVIGTSSSTTSTASTQPLKVNKITFRQATTKLDDQVDDSGGPAVLLAASLSNSTATTVDSVGVGAKSSCSCLFGNGTPIMLEDRKHFLSFAKLKFQPSNVHHGSMLHTIFFSLEGCNVPFGSNRWMDIGFQGCHPSTDIRGTGMLGVLQLLFFIERYPTLAHQLHQLSNKESNKFPMAVTGFHLTLECMRGLRRGMFESVVRREKSVLVAMNLIYVAMMLKFYQGWKVRSYTNHIESIQHFGEYKSEIVLNVVHNSTRAIESLRAYQKRLSIKQ